MVNLDRESRTSKVLSLLRFPLAILIVLIHTSFSDNKSDISFYIGKIVSEGIASIAVPTFFFISGYLFFAKYKSFGWKEYTKAMKTKVLSLVLPYLLWIVIAFYGYGFLRGFDANISPLDFYSIFWAKPQGYMVKSILGYEFCILSTPALGVLWFIRDLIVAMLLTPIFWRIINYLRMYSIILFLTPYFLYLGIPIKGFGLVALTFFPLGATFSICGKDIVTGFTRYSIIVLALFSILLIIKFGVDVSNVDHYRIIDQLLILTGVASSFVLADKILSFSKLAAGITILGEASFFIYAGHTLPIFNPVNSIMMHLQSIPYIGYLTYYILYCVVRILIVTALYFLMKRYCPKILSVLVGGRISTSK